MEYSIRSSFCIYEPYEQSNPQTEQLPYIYKKQARIQKFFKGGVEEENYERKMLLYVSHVYT